jgi:large subunit ribosomal protein L25
METHTLNATARTETGKGVARKARRSGQTPGIIYGPNGTVGAVTVNVAELAAIFRKTNDPNTIVTVSVGDTRHTCLVREIQRHPVSRVVEHIDLYAVAADDTVVADVAVNLVGRAAGTRAGGTLRLLARSMKVRCPAGSIPSKIDVDVTPLEVGQFLKASQVPAPASVSFVYRQDFNVVTVEGKRAREEGAAPAADAKKGK